MYGYLKPFSGISDTKIRSKYKQYYCSLCHALWTNYGQLSRLMVSYDVTFIAIVLSSRFELPDCKIGCLKKITLKRENENWKKLAAFTLLMIASKLEDDIRDDNSKLAKALKRIFKRKFQHIMKEFPNASKTVNKSMKVFNDYEQNNNDVYVLSNSFADVIVHTLLALYPDMNESEIAILRYVSRWVYFMDAVDDLDDDIKNGKKNPLSTISRSKIELLTENKEYIESFIADCTKEVSGTPSRGFETIDIDKLVLANIIDGTIPEISYRVFSNRAAYPKGGLYRIRKIGSVMYG